MHENPIICGQCGGKCCKQSPGVCYPEDFGLPGSPDRLMQALKSGRYCIDWWAGDPRDTDAKCAGVSRSENRDQAYFIRPVYKGEEGRLFHGGWGGECTFLTAFGCPLAADARPKECRHLKPSTGKECDMTGGVSKRQASIEWLPYEELINQCVEQLREREPATH